MKDSADLRPADLGDVTLTADQIAAMRRLVATHAHDTDDAHNLLDALGIGDR